MLKVLMSSSMYDFMHKYENYAYFLVGGKKKGVSSGAISLLKFFGWIVLEKYLYKPYKLI